MLATAIYFTMRIFAFFILVSIAFWYIGGGEQAAMSSTPCQLYNAPYEPVEASPEALLAIHTITAAMGITNDFEVIGGKFIERTPVAAAFVCRNKRYIVYDIEKYNWFGDGATEWRTFGILIHEIGHHVGNHMAIDNKPQKSQELEADYLSGYISGRLGATLEEAYSFTDLVSSNGSDTHPPKERRREEAIKGWKNVQRQKQWERTQCFQAEWSGASFSLNDKQCRIVNLCSKGMIAPRVACQSSDTKWIIQ